MLYSWLSCFLARILVRAFEGQRASGKCEWQVAVTSVRHLPLALDTCGPAALATSAFMPPTEIGQQR